MRFFVSCLAAAAYGLVAQASPAEFVKGPVIADFGATAPVPDAAPLAPETELKVAFDISAAAEPGKVNRQIESAARFINMHAAAGLAPAQVQVAIVVHGPAASDLLAGDHNASAPLIAALLEAGATITLCGQTAAYRDITADQLVEGVTLSLSAMTAHALLQQDGYTLNPF